MSRIFELGLSLADGIIVMDFLLRFNGLKWKNNKKFIIFAILMLVAIEAVTKFTSISALEMISYAVCIIIFSRFTDVPVRWRQAVFSAFLIIMCVVLVNSLTAVIFARVCEVDISSLLIEGNPLRMQCSIIMKLTLFAVTNFIIKFSKSTGRFNLLEAVLMFLIHIFSLFIMEIVFKYQRSFENNELLILIIGILFINIAIYVIYNIINKINSDRLNYQIELQAVKYGNSSVEQLKETEKNIRLIKHELKNKLYSVVDILDNKDAENARQEILSYINEIDCIYSYVNSDNQILNYILNYNVNLAKSRGTEVELVIDQKFDCRLTSSELSSVLNNMLSNAFEALQGQAEPELYIEVSRYARYQKIVVKNSLEKSVLSENPELKTTKEDKENHGFGLKQIKRIVDKYNGYMEIEEDGKHFIIAVFI